MKRCSDERGSAFLEFAISLPFLITVIIGVIDIGRGMREYFLLKAAVIEGAERAMSLSNLTGSLGCSSGTYDRSHEQVHQRVEELLTLQSRALTTPCVSSAVSSSDKTVMVRASAKFQAIFPLFDGVSIAAEARMPYLR